MNGFPEDVRRFLQESINSVEQLEVLLLLRESPERSWSAEEVSRKLCTQPDAAAKRLADLQSLRLLAPVEGAIRRYRYGPAVPEAAQVVDRLAEVYKERRVAVITVIYSKPLKQVKAFAEAFRIRRED